MRRRNRRYYFDWADKPRRDIRLRPWDLTREEMGGMWMASLLLVLFMIAWILLD
jgi:hypothetical protein